MAREKKRKPAIIGKGQKVHGSIANPAVAKRRRSVAKLHLAGYGTVDDIAHKLGVTANTIRADLKALSETWREMAAEDIAKHKAKLMAKLEMVQREAWRGWARSLEGSRKHAEGDNGKLGPHTLEEWEDNPPGEPKYLTDHQQRDQQPIQDLVPRP